MFEYSLTNDFFSCCDKDFDIREGSIEAGLTAERNGDSVSVVMNLRGEVTVLCDRCLENLSIPVNTETRLSVRFTKPDGETDVEDDAVEEDIMYADVEGEEIDLSAYAYESVCLSLPMQRVHGRDANGKSLCNPEMLKYISNVDSRENSSPFGILKDIIDL
ncbi:MAG: DUF177 domain-containing protein [Prevotellaceae bacterium]|jgi:uncharacterized metal-binding protein YceD (DUF177 family)|nr:DUF177 domain-containing protein [Prevotellaceae bacterium]